MRLYEKRRRHRRRRRIVISSIFAFLAIGLAFLLATSKKRDMRLLVSPQSYLGSPLQ